MHRSDSNRGRLNRRDFLAAPLAGALAVEAAAQRPIPIIDTHIHLFDPTRPGGVPWPPQTNATLYKPALPPRYRGLAAPHGITGAIEVECNQWVLDVAEKDTIMVGTVGNLEPGKPGFRAHLDRLTKNPLFRGIRWGTLWGRKFTEEIARPECIADLKALAAAGRSLDSATAGAELIAGLVRLTDRVPELRVIIDHLPQFNPPAEAAPLKEYQANLRELAKRPQVFVKGSEVLRRVDGKVIEDLAFYKPRLDELWGLFGDDRMIYGSDWPNSDNWAPYDRVFRIVNLYIQGRGREAAEKYFWRNSVRAYRWMKRHPSQPAA